MAIVSPLACKVEMKGFKLDFGGINDMVLIERCIYSIEVTCVVECACYYKSLDSLPNILIINVIVEE